MKKDNGLLRVDSHKRLIDRRDFDTAEGIICLTNAWAKGYYATIQRGGVEVWSIFSFVWKEG